MSTVTVVKIGRVTEIRAAHARIQLTREEWDSLCARTPEAVALKELLEAIDGAPGIGNHVTPELASALQEARVLVRRMEDTSDEKE